MNKIDIDKLNKLDDEGDLLRAIKTIVQLYTDKAHFVYELLQNAEDCKATEVSFKMFSDRLEMLHNGEPFTEVNLKSLRSVALTTKTEDANAIGKFGVGFKSVFGICETVILCCDRNNYIEQKNDYLPPFACRIKDFRKLEELESDVDVPNRYTTKYIFPFCVNEDFSGYKTLESLHENLSNRLRKLGTSVLLFMRNIQEISYSICGIHPECDGDGAYLLQKDKISDNCYKIVGIGKNTSDDISYLMYSKSTNYNKDVNIAFACEWINGAPVFSDVHEKHICVYFPTDTPSNINFVVQAPYGTTPNRGGIPAIDENYALTKELAILLQDAILDIRNKKWLTLDFLNLLPINKNKDYGMLHTLHEKMRDLIGNEDILFTISEGYVNKENARIVIGDWIAELFNGERLCALVKNTNVQWLPTNLSMEKFSNLYDILTKQYSLKVIQANNLPALLRENKDIWRLADEKWLASFYNYLLERVPGMLGKQGDFSTVPFIKTMRGEYVAPYKYDNKTQKRTPNVFLQPKNTNKNIENFNFVDVFIMRDCLDFLNAMGIEEPDGFSFLIAELNDKNDGNEISERTQVLQLKRAIKYLKEEYHDNAIEEFRNKLFLRCIAINNGEIINTTCELKQLYRQVDVKTDMSIEKYFSGLSHSDIGILDEEFYVKNGIALNDLQILHKLGVKNTVISLGQNEWHDGAHCKNFGDFKRDLNFDKIKNILYHITTNGNKEKSAMIFTMLKKIERHLKGKYIRGAYRQDSIPSESSIIETMKSEMWLFDKNGNQVRACDITRHELDRALYDEVDKFSKIYIILGFKEDPIDVFLNNIKIEELSSVQKQQIIEQITPIIKIQDIFDDIYDPEVNEAEEPPMENIVNIDRLKSKTIDAYNKAEDVRYEYVALSKRVSGGGERDHIKSRYEGFCQICKIYSNYWVAPEIFLEPKKELVEMHISLCPNCASRYKLLRNDSEKIKVFKQNLLNFQFDNENEKIGLDDGTIYFTQKHLAEIKIILTEMEKG